MIVHVAMSARDLVTGSVMDDPESETITGRGEKPVDLPHVENVMAKHGSEVRAWRFV